MTPAEVEAYLHEQIPLSAAMGMSVLQADAESVVLEAPLAPNLNHRATAFGGSVSTLAIVAGWTSVHFRLRREGFEVHTVIHESRVRYVAPIRGSFRARAPRVDDSDWARFTRALRRRGKGRVRVAVDVEAGDGLAASFRGSYVALAHPDS